MEDRVIARRFLIQKQIALGGFSKVYVGEDLRNGGVVVMKVEDPDQPVTFLYYEYQVLKVLRGSPGIPSCHFFWEEDDGKVMVMDCLGRSLASYLRRLERFTLKTTLMLADQMLGCLEYIHNKNMIHRDIKPGNFLMGSGKRRNRVFLTDFGLAKRYRDVRTHAPLKRSQNDVFVGTGLFAAIDAHEGFEQSRRDDLESMAFMLVYLLKGKLPWKEGDIQGPIKERILHQQKRQTSISEICDGVPPEFMRFMFSVKNLGYTERPDYAGYRKMFRDLFIRQGYVYDYHYDWIKFVPETVEVEATPDAKIFPEDAPLPLQKTKSLPEWAKSKRSVCKY